MSNTVDNRVVEMQFNNREFENNIQTSVKSLEDLKKGLDLEDSAKGLEGLGRAANNIDFSRLADSVEAIAGRFSLVGNIVQGVYGEVTNALLGMTHQAENFVKSLTIEPVKTGFQEYETQINAIQTIMSNTRDSLTKQGYSDAERLEMVNDRLDQLNHYADKTIYNFTEMTRNIGTFTAAGVELDTAVNSIQGIANLAAVSGSTSEQASRGMYQLSQAIAAGTVRLQDWRSVENAGFGGAIFQKALQRTAKAMNVTIEKTVIETNAAGKKVKKTVHKTVDELIADAGSFQQSLSDGWLSSDVLTATLEQFSWDFEQMAKDTGKTVDEIKELKMSDLLSSGYTKDEAEAIIALAEDATKAATEVKTFTQLFDTLKEAAQSGWTQTWEYIIGDFDEAKKMLTEISTYFGDIIEASATARNEIVKGWKDLGGRDEMIAGFWNIVHTVENIVGILHEEFEKVFPPATSQKLFDITKSFRNLTESVKNFTENEEKMAVARRIIAGVANGLDILKQVLGGIWSGAKQIFDYVLPHTGGLFEWLAKIGDKLVAVNQELKESGGIQNVVQKVVDSVKMVIDFIRELITNGPEAAMAKLREWFSGFDEFAKKVEDFFNTNPILKGIKDFFGNIVTSITDFVTNMDGADIAVAISSILGASLVIKVMKFIKSLKDIKDKICGSIGEISEGITDALGSFKQNKDITGSILKIAASLALLAGAFYIIAQVDQDKIVTSLAVMGAMMAAVTAMAVVLSKIGLKKAASLGVTSVGLMLLGSAILIFAGALERLGKLKPEELIQGVTGLGLVMLEIYGFLNLTDGLKSGIAKGFSMILIATSMIIFAKAISQIGKMDTNAMLQGVVGLGLVMLEIYGFLNLTDGLKGGVAKGFNMILIATSMIIFAKAISQIGEMDTNMMLQGVVGLGLVMLEIYGFLNLTDGLQSGVSKGFGILLIATAMIVFAKAISKIGEMDVKVLIQGVAGLGLVMLEIAAFLNLTNKAEVSFGKGVALVLIGASLILFAKSIKKIGEMDPGSMLQGVIGLGLVMLEICGFMALMQKLEVSFQKGVGLLAIAAGLILFAKAISDIGNMNTGAMLQGVIGLGLVMLEIAAFLAIMKKLDADIRKSIGLVLIAASLNLFAKALSSIGKLRFTQILKGVVGLGLVMLELAAFMKIAGKMPATGIVKSLVMLGVMIVSMQVFAKVLKHVQDIDVSTMLGFGVSFGVALLGLTGAMTLISALPFTAILLGLAKLALVVAGIAALMALFGAVQQKWDVASYISSFGDIAEAIGSAMGRFIGGIGSGIMKGLDLPNVGTQLSDFMTNIQPFLDGVKGVDESVKTGVGNLAAAMIAIGGAEIVNAIASWFTGDNPISKFGDDIGDIAKALNNFATSLGGFTETDEGTITNAVNTAKALTELVQAVPWDAPEWATAIIGSKNVEAFAEDAKTLATALMNYATGISGFGTTVSDEDITNSTAAAKALVELQNALPAEGGWIQKLTGVKDLSGFALEAVGFAAGMRVYAAAIKGFTESADETDMENANNAAKALIELADALPATGGWLQKLIGVKSLSNFAVQIPGFALGMKVYAQTISGFTESVTEDDITNSTNAAKALVELANSMPADGGWLQKIIGSQDLGEFGTKCEQFGKGLASFASSIGSVSVESTESAIKATGMIQEFASGLDTEGGVWQNIGEWFGGSKDIVSLSQQMADFGTNFSSFSSQITGAQSALTDFNVVKTIIDSFTSISKSIKDGEIDAWDIEMVGETLASTFKDSMVVTITDSSGSVVEAIGVIATDVENTKSAWVIAGQNLSIGLANGIRAMTYRVRDAAASVASAGANAVHQTWDEHSPSKVGEELGMYFDLGIAGGLEAYSKVVSDKAENMSQNVVDSAKTMLRGADSSIFDNIDPNPTIRPVMDLTNIQNGVAAMNGMFTADQIIGGGMFRGVQANRRIDSMTYDGGRIAGGQSNKDIVAEIHSMREQFDGLNKAVANMKIVLDTGLLVGATSGQMDNELGTLAMRRGRGN